MEIEHREDNIFYNVIRNETSLTEVFCNLMQYKAFRDLFLNYVNNKTNNLDSEDFDKITYNNFETEKEFKFYEEQSKEDKKIGRGDLILNVNELDYIFELKIETTTRTTKNQPKGYLEYLKEQDKNNNIENYKYKDRLFFILPKGYKHKDKLAQAVQVNILYWEDFLAELKKSELNKLNIFVNDFYNIVYENWFYFSKLNFNNFELSYIYNMEKLQMNNSAIPTIMMKLLGIIDELQRSYKSHKYDQDFNALEYSFWIKDSKKKKVFWFGVDYEVWEEYKNPLVIGFIDDEKEIYCKKFKKYYADKIVTSNKGIFLPLKVDILKSEDTLAIKKVIDEVIEIIGMSKQT